MTDLKISKSLAEALMQEALKEAEIAVQAGEVPVGAVVADASGAIISRAHNEVEGEKSGVFHAEILALMRASEALGRWRLSSEILCVTLEPCTMCAGAIQTVRIPAVIFGARDPRLGACGSLYDVLRHPELPNSPKLIEGVMANKCSEILKKFFETKRG